MISLKSKPTIVTIYPLFMKSPLIQLATFFLLLLLITSSQPLNAQTPSIETYGLIQLSHQIDNGNILWNTQKFEGSEIYGPSAYYDSYAKVKYYYGAETEARYGFWWSETKTTYRRSGLPFTVYTNSADAYTRQEGYALHSASPPSFNGTDVYYTGALVREKTHMAPRFLVTASPTQIGSKQWDVVVKLWSMSSATTGTCSPKVVTLSPGQHTTIYPCSFSSWDWLMNETVYPH